MTDTMFPIKILWIVISCAQMESTIWIMHILNNPANHLLGIYGNMMVKGSYAMKI